MCPRFAIPFLAVALALGSAQGAIAFRFDDNHSEDDWNDVARLFEEEGLRCSFAVVSGGLDAGQGRCLKALAGRGFEIMDHTASHAMYVCQWLDAADFAAETNHPFVVETDPAARKVYCRAEVDLSHEKNVAFTGRVRAGVLETDDAAAAKRLTWTQKVWFPSRRELLGIDLRDGRRTLRDFWGREIAPFDLADSELKLVDQIAIQPCDGLLRLQARATRANLAKFGLGAPQTWIQPGGWEAFVDARRLSSVYGREFGYTGADCVMPNERCWFSTDDKTPRTLVNWMQRPSFSYFDEGVSFEKVIAQIEQSEKVALPLVFISHMSWRNAGGREAWLKATRDVLRWAKRRKVPVLTERELTRQCYTERYGRPRPDAWWWKRLAEKRQAVESLRGKSVDIVLMGDSITHGWDNQPALARLRKRYTVLPLGYNGDVVASVLYRVWDGELDGFTAKNVFVMIGTNNLGGGGEQPAKVIAQTKRLLDSIREKQPTAKVWLLAVLPRDVGHRETPKLWPERITAYNRLLKGLADGERVVWHDLGAKFLRADGSLNDALYWDRLHPREAGYEVWADEILALLDG